ncbi:hypothetical protein Tco_0037153 [Tanacetum coccineum]
MQLVLLGEKGKLLLSPQQVIIGDHKDTTGKMSTTGTMSPNTMVDPILEIDYPHRALKNKGIVDSGCSRHMTGNKACLAEFQDFNGGPVIFRGSKGYITGKGKIKTGKLDFEDVCFLKELQHFNLFSVSQICDKKNKVLFTDSECLVLSPEFKLPDENQVLLKILRQNNMYSFNLENFSKLIFDGMIRHLDAKKKFVMYPCFISIFLDNQLANVPVPLDHFPVNALTSKVFSFMVKKGKHFSGKVTPLFACMLVQPIEDEGAPLERPSEAQPTPSPTHTSEVPLVPQIEPSPTHTSEVPVKP